MKLGGKTFICLLCVVCLTTMVRAVTSESESTSTETAPADDRPYSAIWLRNVFDLKPTPPPAPVEAPKPATPPSNVELTGITTLLGGKKAMFIVQPPAVNGKVSKDLSLMLAEGERKDGLEVMQINLKDGTVKIKNDDVVSTIGFKTNKTASAGPAGVPGNPAGVRPNQPVPFSTPGGVPIPPRPTRTMGMPQASATPQGNYAQPMNQAYSQGYSAAGYNQGTATATPGLSIPGNSLFNAPTQAAEVGHTSSLSAEEQIALMLARQQQNQNDAVSHPNQNTAPLPPMPPIPGVTDTGGSSTGSSSAASPPVPPSVPTPQLPSWLAPKTGGSYH